MNVLSRAAGPRRAVAARRAAGTGSTTARRCWCARSQFRLEKIEHRLEVLDGYLIAYLNLDEVIRIVRYEDEPKAKLIERFKLTEVQAEAILNLRLQVAVAARGDRDHAREHDKLSKERRELKSLLKSDELQWERIADEVKATREAYSKKTDARPPPHLVRRRARRSRSTSSRR